MVLYSNNCQRCRILKKHLEKGSFNFTVFDNEEAMIEMGFQEMPILEVDGQKMNFETAIKWINSFGRR